MLCYQKDNYLYLLKQDLKEVGVYILKIKLLPSIFCEEDYLQDTIKLAKEFAYKKWRIEVNKWRECNYKEIKILKMNNFS